MCCKLPSIEALAKPADKWCKFCKPGHGRCMIYNVRPEPCQAFHCEWLRHTDFDECWYPQTAKMVLTTSKASDDGMSFMNVLVDLGWPNRWREAPYYERLKHMAQVGTQHKVMVRVHVGQRSWVVLPHVDVEIPDDVKTFNVVKNSLGLWNLQFIR